MSFPFSSLWQEVAGSSASSSVAASSADRECSGGYPVPSSWMGDSTSSSAWSQGTGSLSGGFDGDLSPLDGHTSEGPCHASSSRGRSQDGQVTTLDAAYMPVLSSSQFNFPSNYFSVWSGTAPRPVPSSSSSNPSATFALNRMPNLPPLSSNHLPSSSTSSAPLSRYAQLVQAKMRNTSLASASASASSSGSCSSNSLWSVPPPPSKAPSPSPQTPFGIWSNPPSAGGPRMDQMGDQQLLDFQQGPNVCNSSFVGYNKQTTNFGLGSTSLGFGGFSEIAGEVQPDIVGERSTRREPSQSVDGSKEGARSRAVGASPASSSSESSSKRKRPSGGYDDEQQDDETCGNRQLSHRPSSSLPPNTSPFPNPQNSSSSPSNNFNTSNWLPSSSSSSLLSTSYLPISTTASGDTESALSSYHNSSYVPGTGYAALPTPTVSRYPSMSTDNGAWWTKINLTSNDPLPEVDASFVYSSFPTTTSGSSNFEGNQPAPAGSSSSQDRYSYIASAHSVQTPRSNSSRSSGSGELSRYQQLMALKYAASKPNPSLPQSTSSTFLPSGFQTSTVASPPTRTSALNSHLASASALEYSQYPISSSSGPYFFEPTNSSNPQSSSSSSRSFPIPQPSTSPPSTSSSFPSYIAGAGSYSEGFSGYQPVGSMSGHAASSGWASKPYQDASQSRHSNRSDSWTTAESSTSSSVNSSLPTSMAPPYTNPLSLLHLPPTPTLSTPHRSPQPLVPTPGSLTVALPPPTPTTQQYESLLLPTVLAGRPLISILPSPATVSSSCLPSASASISPPSPLQPLIALASLPSPSLSNLSSIALPNPANSSTSLSPGAASSSMPPPPIPPPKSAVGPSSVSSLNSEDWESISPSSGAAQRKGRPRAKKIKQESPPEETEELEEREGSPSSTSGKGEDKKKKLLLACHFCRGRKLKCDGNRDQCANCVLRGTPCTYDTEIRRRGPGRKKISLGAGGDGEEPYRDPNSTASKPTRMKGVGSGHGLKMSKAVKKKPTPEPVPVADDEDGEGEEEIEEEEEGVAVMGWTG